MVRHPSSPTHGVHAPSPPHSRRAPAHAVRRSPPAQAQASQVLQTTVVQVGGGGPERYAERMARAREFCADSGAASAGPPAYATQPAASYGASAWAAPNQSAQQQNYKQEEVRQVPQEMQVDAGGAFVVPTLVSPSAKQDMKAFVMESGPNGEAWARLRGEGVFEIKTKGNFEKMQFSCFK